MRDYRKLNKPVPFANATRRDASDTVGGGLSHRYLTANEGMLIDFLIAKSRTQVRGNVSPIEVKSGYPSCLSLPLPLRAFRRTCLRGLSAEGTR